MTTEQITACERNIGNAADTAKFERYWIVRFNAAMDANDRASAAVCLRNARLCREASKTEAGK